MPTKNRTDLVPEPPADLRRQDPIAGGVPQAEDLAVRDTQPSEDGGVEQHPVHDDDQEDLQPEDFEEEIDAASKGGFDPADKYEIDHEAGRKLKDPGPV